MSVLLIVRPKCTLTASHAAPWWVTVSMPTGQTDGRTDAWLLHYAFRCNKVAQRWERDSESLNEFNARVLQWPVHFIAADCTPHCDLLTYFTVDVKTNDKMHPILHFVSDEYACLWVYWYRVCAAVGENQAFFVEGWRNVIVSVMLAFTPISCCNHSNIHAAF